MGWLMQFATSTLENVNEDYKLGKQALRDPRTLKEYKIRNDWERVRRILVRRYKRLD